MRFLQLHMTTTISTQTQTVSLLRRFGVILYDLVLLISVIFVAAFIPVILFNIKYGDPFFFLFQIYIFLVSYLFYAWFWTRSGQTLGMRTWKVKVVNEDGSNINWTRALIRYLLAIVSALIFGLGFFWSLWDREHRTWYDMFSKTKLIKVE